MAKYDLRSAAGWPHSQPADLPDWQLLTHSARPNGLIIGPSALTIRVLRQLEGCLRTPVVHWPRDGDPWKSPVPPSTAILHQVTTLTRADQEALQAWLIVAGQHVQVIATASRRVYPLVESGAFLEALYYRISCVVVDCAMCSGRPVRTLAD
jgi:hypothetical protein